MERIDQLIALYYEGALDSKEWDELRGLLKSDPENLRHFCDLAEFEQELRDVAAEQVERVEMEPVVSKNRNWLFAAAALVIFGLGLSVLWNLEDSSSEVLAEVTISPHGRVVMSGRNLGDESERKLVAGSTVRVAQGSAEIQFKEGVRCLIEAPAELTLKRKGLVILKNGRARFDVEERAQGFQVISGDLHLTDLGTTFGVDASRESPEVHVLSGLVIGQDVRGDREESRVEGGQAMVLAGNGGLTPIPIDEDRFSPSLGKGIPALYLSFDEVENGESACEGSIASRDAVQLNVRHSHAPEEGEGRFGKALKFDGKKTYARTNWPGIGGAKARSVSFWLKASEADRANPILGWGLERGGRQMSFFGLRLGASGHLRIVSGNRWLEGSVTLDDGAWHHVVVVTGSFTRGAWPVTRVYVDGERNLVTPQVPFEQRSAKLDSFWTVTDHPDSEPLVIGRLKEVEEDKPWRLASFSGLLDEVIVAEGLIDEAGAKALYEGRLTEAGLDIEGR